LRLSFRLSKPGSLVKPFRTLVSAGNTVVCEVFPAGSAGLLHDSALWLRPPTLSDAIANDCPPCSQASGIASAIVPTGTGLPLLAELSLLLIQLCRSARLLFRPAEGFAGDKHAVQDHLDRDPQTPQRPRQLANQRPRLHNDTTRTQTMLPQRRKQRPHIARNLAARRYLSRRVLHAKHRLFIRYIKSNILAHVHFPRFA